MGCSDDMKATPVLSHMSAESCENANSPRTFSKADSSSIELPPTGPNSKIGDDARELSEKANKHTD